MSRKACSPDNAACEGFFGRLKNELFYSRDWLSTTIEDFVEALDIREAVRIEGKMQAFQGQFDEARGELTRLQNLKAQINPDVKGE